MIAFKRYPPDRAARVRQWRPQLTLALLIVEQAAMELGAQGIVVTSGDEPRAPHMRHSRHWDGAAFDFTLAGEVNPDRLEQIVGRVKDRLPRDFDIVFEHTHGHVEWDPKGGVS